MPNQESTRALRIEDYALTGTARQPLWSAATAPLIGWAGPLVDAPAGRTAAAQGQTYGAPPPAGLPPRPGPFVGSYSAEDARASRRPYKRRCWPVQSGRPRRQPYLLWLRPARRRASAAPRSTPSAIRERVPMRPCFPCDGPERLYPPQRVITAPGIVGIPGATRSTVPASP